uniref:Transposase n=1 Tax=Haemonchus contortus TaxID=6289 RepID=A0A7I4YCU3_HAECO
MPEARLGCMITFARLGWYDHVLRVDEDSVRKIGLNFDVSGKRPRDVQSSGGSIRCTKISKRLKSTPIKRSIGRSCVKISEKRTPPARVQETNAEE